MFSKVSFLAPLLACCFFVLGCVGETGGVGASVASLECLSTSSAGEMATTVSGTLTINYGAKSAQSFPGSDTRLVKIVLNMADTTATKSVQSVTLSITQDCTAFPCDQVLAQAKVDASALSSAAQDVVFILDFPVEMHSGSTYWMALSFDSDDPTSFLSLTYDSAGAYAGGTLANRPAGGTWAGGTGDFWFQNYQCD